MFNRFPPAPAKAETFTLSDFTSYRPAGKSRWLPDRERPAVEVLSCPACGTEQAIPDHGLHTGCCNCDLLWVRFGNSLNIWRDDTATFLKLISERKEP